MSRWRCIKRAAGSVKCPTGVTVWSHWSNCVAGDFGALAGWHARAHVRQSFWTPGQAKRCATSFADDLVPGCDRSWTAADQPAELELLVLEFSWEH
jgi:hypothetical protein